ncbi:mammalian cell entry protein [Mycolicibacterium holsaticum]|uniref:Mammalian cell entry protein n=1 Tax=Mycolicibacterium holsaticum TaxID=152142 RepID=A0A1E3R351_9MYCO|nr:MlaD family protein [Mycolicibacterium holsaticum]ODQ84303.1 mammalian cell entry protein [Mycolicibacterium holsaticum]QZA15562.1 MlaD family protein [Mycolicibacterium holsaticum DSM 44478 = JCM 12374]UNC12162.1 MCE family protein [Mycolicibacterium holsaticum DSM 44478 = JCM 12374]
MRLRDVISFLAFGAIVVFVLAYFAALGLRVAPPDDRTTLSMEVPDINGLVVGSNVLLRGVPVGKVTSTATSLQAATVDFYVTGNQQIPVDTELRLENLSALGESYILLMPRSAGGPMLQSGQRFSTEEIVQPPSVSELATSVTRVLSQMEPGALKRVIGEADAALPDPNTALPNISRASVLLNNTVEEMDGRGRLLLGNFETLLKNAEWVSPILISLTPRLREFSRGYQDFMKHVPILDHRGEPHNVSNLNKLMARIQGLLDDRGGDLKVLGEALQPKLNMIAATLMNFDTGQLLDNILKTVPPDGTITLRVTP